MTWGRSSLSSSAWGVANEGVDGWRGAGALGGPEGESEWGRRRRRERVTPSPSPSPEAPPVGPWPSPSSPPSPPRMHRRRPFSGHRHPRPVQGGSFSHVPGSRLRGGRGGGGALSCTAPPPAMGHCHCHWPCQAQGRCSLSLPSGDCPAPIPPR
jgi:hypothetical protein